MNPDAFTPCIFLALALAFIAFFGAIIIGFSESKLRDKITGTLIVCTIVSAVTMFGLLGIQAHISAGYISEQTATNLSGLDLPTTLYMTAGGVMVAHCFADIKPIAKVNTQIQAVCEVFLKYREEKEATSHV